MFNLQTFAIGAGAAAVALGIAFTYNLKENADIRKEARSLALADAERTTMEVINEIGTQAERSRAKLRYCLANGMRYDFGNPGKCEPK